jgi:[ribosomal protein S18]-alanine N-acetyltransferase
MLTLRGATLDDLDDIMAIETVSFPTPWRREAMQDELRGRKEAHYIAAEVEGVLVGYAGMWCYAGEAHIMNVALAPDHRRRGYGEALMLDLLRRAVEQAADLAYLEVRPSNSAAIALYRKLGFRTVGYRPNYYRDTGEDAMLMTLDGLRRRWSVVGAELWAGWERRHGYRPEAR